MEHAEPEEPAGAVEADARSDGRRRRTLAPLLVAGVLIVGLAALAVLAIRQPAATPAASVAPTIVAGTPGGQVISGSAASPSPATSTPAATPSASVAPTDAPTPSPTPTPAPVAIATPEPQPPSPAPTPVPPPVAPAPTPVVAAVAEPDDAVARFYGHVVAGNFDAAYALWSDRMKATYPRQKNLDDRFAETVQITFQDLFVAERGAGTATVQANFTETYASGAGRQFIGYWRLILVDGRWLLDEPNY